MMFKLVLGIVLLNLLILVIRRVFFSRETKGEFYVPPADDLAKRSDITRGFYDPGSPYYPVLHDRK